jgi:hypothetical protein
MLEKKGEVRGDRGQDRECETEEHRWIEVAGFG